MQIVSMAAEYTSLKVPKVLAERISDVAIKHDAGCCKENPLLLNNILCNL